MKALIFIAKILVIAIILFALMFVVIMPQYTTGFNAAIIDKYQRLRSIDEPKIILVGDSNVAFGFDSRMIGEAFNMPVVNFGLHGGLGQAFHTDMIKSHIHEGDIVIIIPAVFNEETSKIADPVLAWVTIENHFFLWSGISAQNYWDMILAYPTYLNRAARLFLLGEGNGHMEGFFVRAAFNEYGDNVYPRPVTELVYGESVLSFNCDYLSAAMRDYWNEYNEFVISRGATLFISSPPILDDQLEVDPAVLQSQLDNELNFPMISQLEDYIFPREYFFESGFHLNEIGVAVRTELFIRDLMLALGTPRIY